ncbi:MAG: hypothetical protein U1E76_23250 [Planctomycetota bacterium]
MVETNPAAAAGDVSFEIPYFGNERFAYRRGKYRDLVQVLDPAGKVVGQRGFLHLGRSRPLLAHFFDKTGPSGAARHTVFLVEPGAAGGATARQLELQNQIEVPGAQKMSVTRVFTRSGFHISIGKG